MGGLQFCQGWSTCGSVVAGQEGTLSLQVGGSVSQHSKGGMVGDGEVGGGVGRGGFLWGGV